MSLFFMCLWALIFIAVWEFCWKKTMTDRSRDRLFDLRDSMRLWFIEHDVSLDSPQYHAARRILNTHIRYISGKSSPATIIVNIVILYNNKKILSKLTKDIEKEIISDDEQVNEYLKSIRLRAARYTGFHSLFSSFPLLLMMPVFFNCRASISFVLGYMEKNEQSDKWDTFV